MSERVLSVSLDIDILKFRKTSCQFIRVCTGFGKLIPVMPDARYEKVIHTSTNLQLKGLAYLRTIFLYNKAFPSSNIQSN